MIQLLWLLLIADKPLVLCSKGCRFGQSNRFVAYHWQSERHIPGVRPFFLRVYQQIRVHSGPDTQLLLGSNSRKTS